MDSPRARLRGGSVVSTWRRKCTNDLNVRLMKCCSSSCQRSFTPAEIRLPPNSLQRSRDSSNATLTPHHVAPDPHWFTPQTMCCRSRVSSLSLTRRFPQAKKLLYIGLWSTRASRRPRDLVMRQPLAHETHLCRDAQSRVQNSYRR